MAGHLTAAVDGASRALAEEDPRTTHRTSSGRQPSVRRSPRRPGLGGGGALRPPAAGAQVEAASADHGGLADPVCAAALALVRSRLMRAGDDLAGALRVLTHWRERRAHGTPSWLHRRFEVAEALTLLADGRPEDAESRIQQSTTPEAPACLLAYGWITLATGGAAESWRTARQVSRETAIPLELVVEAHLLAAAGALALSRPEAAGAGVDEAVRLASGEGLRRPFGESAPAAGSPATARAAPEHPAAARGVRRPRRGPLLPSRGKARAPGASVTGARGDATGHG